MVSTTIQISQKLQKELSNKKLFSRQTYEEVIWDLVEDTNELTDETIRDIREARREIKSGKFTRLRDLKHKYKIK
ncbi:hypothetical protein HOF78_01425 [Candidatus Woesearchaeota archaeon]|jgi:hypothetical protein|nr:hypothetical protein [Candidatus Woesearchaeota archaeon]MBT6044955.1 hypothetical protein [Candidatus Woesearchaeota archaeon]